MDELEKITKQITDKTKNLGERPCIVCGKITEKYGIAIDQGNLFGEADAGKQRIAFYPICEEHKGCDEEVLERLRTKAQAMRN